MKSRALRLTLLALFVGLAAGAAYVLWDRESRAAAVTATARNFDDQAQGLARALLDLKGAQPGYVAFGQGEDFWVARVDGLLTSAREALTSLGSLTGIPQTETEIEAVASAFADFQRLDRRAREYARNDQRLLASDLVFSDGIVKLDTALAALDRARSSEAAAAGAAGRGARREQALVLAGAAALGILIVCALVPLPEEQPAAIVKPEPAETPAPRRTAATRVSVDGPSRPPVAAPIPDAPRALVPASAVELRPAVVEAPPVSVPAVDLPAVAMLCTDLSRVLDRSALPGVLERAAALLDATGIVLWIADPDGRELTPIVAHGYPPGLVARMGTIERDAGNVTASAFRTGLVQTVNGENEFPGAIAAPLLSAGGPVGVMAAEVLRDGERRDNILAIATIVAAQLATLVGPPAARPAKATEAANA